uniref:Uncharacterized protein n=1 Tax=Aquila chrysaetos chrysaetos TaxID=223781 RepID=A0A663ESE4_AQUCH
WQGEAGAPEHPRGRVLVPTGVCSSPPPACLLCRRAEADPALCGDKLEKRGLCAHVFCLVSYLFQRGDREAGLMGFLPEDIRRTIARAAQKVSTFAGALAQTRERNPSPSSGLWDRSLAPSSSGTHRRCSDLRSSTAKLGVRRVCWPGHR